MAFGFDGWGGEHRREGARALARAQLREQGGAEKQRAWEKMKKKMTTKLQPAAASSHNHIYSLSKYTKEEAKSQKKA